MKKLKKLLLSLTCVLTGIPAAQADLITVTADITANETWYATNQYLLDTVVYVQTNATLTIEPGTVVYGATNASVGKPGIPSLVSALWVTRGGQLWATGTVDKPIIFTAEGDDLNGNIAPTDTALWGGVVILGNAQINSAGDATGDAASPRFEVYEGTSGPGPNNEHVFGGSDDNDSSGALRYVCIKHAGNQFAPNKELNALTMGGLGQGTTLEYVETYAGSDDGFEWWGGSVNSKYLVSSFIEDDDFDTDQGYRGTNQFWFAVKLPGGNATSDSRGMETDGDVISGSHGLRTPISKWFAYNVTVLGRGTTNTASSSGVAWNTRDGAAPNVFNSVFAGWNWGLDLDGDGQYHFTNAPVEAFIENNVWDVNVGAFNATDVNEGIFTNGAFVNTIEDALLVDDQLIDGVVNPRPLGGSPVFSDVKAGAPMAVSYRGAFDWNDRWADGWSCVSSLGYLVPAMPELSIVKVGLTVEISWLGLAGATYQLESKSPITGLWSADGDTEVGTGGIITVTRPAGMAEEYYRVSLTE
jgi:hypothetical protein